MFSLYHPSPSTSSCALHFPLTNLCHFLLGCLLGHMHTPNLLSPAKVDYIYWVVGLNVCMVNLWCVCGGGVLKKTNSPSVVSYSSRGRPLHALSPHKVYCWLVWSYSYLVWTMMWGVHGHSISCVQETLFHGILPTPLAITSFPLPLLRCSLSLGCRSYCHRSVIHGWALYRH